MRSPTTAPGADVRSAPATDRPRFADAARPHLAELYSLARCLAGDPGSAEGLVRRCLLNAHRDYRDLPEVETLRGWLTHTLIVCSQGPWRTHGPARRERSLGDPRQGVPDAGDGGSTAVLRQPVPGLLSTLEMDDVWAMLERLKPIYRVPLVLVQMEGYSTAEVADLLDTAADTVRSRLYEGGRQFQRQLWNYAQEHALLAEPGR